MYLSTCSCRIYFQKSPSASANYWAVCQHSSGIWANNCLSLFLSSSWSWHLAELSGLRCVDVDVGSGCLVFGKNNCWILIVEC